ncbi:MAG TPA: carbon storage regulator [Gemmataceae bacterium]
MLVLSRKRGEQIVIPGLSITVTVIAMKGNKVRLGIAAPAEAVVLREELVRRKKRGGGTGSRALDSSNP